MQDALSKIAALSVRPLDADVKAGSAECLLLAQVRKAAIDAIVKIARLADGPADVRNAAVSALVKIAGDAGAIAAVSAQLEDASLVAPPPRRLEGLVAARRRMNRHLNRPL